MELELASRYKRRATKVDVSAAYLNAEIEDSENIMMWLTRELTVVLVEAMPELKRYVDGKGRLVVKILKALYGLVQSAALWFNLLYGYLMELGLCWVCAQQSRMKV